MDLILVREEWRADGIISVLLDLQGEFISYALEHAYLDSGGEYYPKIPDGTYSCVRGMHQLHNNKPFETFEVIGVEGHSGLLFHSGNMNSDSDGCILVGLSLGNIGSQKALLNSRAAFQKLLALQVGCDQFWLSVKST